MNRPKLINEDIYYCTDKYDAIYHIYNGSDTAPTSGYHYPCDTLFRKIIASTIKLGDNGFFKADVKFDNGKMKHTVKNKTFFPKNYSQQQMDDDILSVYQIRDKQNGKFSETSKSGIEILMWLEDDKIRTAYPIINEIIKT